ncbi:MAG: hypothetical protein ACTSWZ_02115 [Candidatus Heimdallarchaeaceae archaeon]
MVGKDIYIEVPIIGEQQVPLKKESSQIYEAFKDEILRLKNIMQLGALHYFSDRILKYSRYDHVLTMLLLISRLKEMTNTKKRVTKRGLGTEVRLNGVRFSSMSELLKSWTLLYPIGHFQMTFATEHAFLEWIKSEENRENEFLKLVKEQIENSKLFKNESKKIKEDLYNQLKNIVIQEKVMQVYKLFTILKILKKAEKLQDNELIPKFRELVKLMIFRDKYPDYEDPKRQNEEHNKKIRDIVNYFLMLRKLSFTVLDSYVAQSPVQFNYHTIMNGLFLFFEDIDYQKVIDDVEEFYTKTVYQSIEGAYYHLRALKVIREEVFDKYISISEFLEDALSNRLDEKIEKVIKEKVSEVVDERHDGKIRRELEDAIEIRLVDLGTNLFKPVSYELKFLKKVQGLILYNMASKEYQIYMYPSLGEFSNKIEKIQAILNTCKVFYEPVIVFDRQTKPKTDQIKEKIAEIQQILRKPEKDQSVSKILDHALSVILDKFEIEIDQLSTLSVAVNSSSSIVQYILEELFVDYEIQVEEVPFGKRYINKFKFPFITQREFVDRILSTKNKEEYQSLSEATIVELELANELLKQYNDSKKFIWYLTALDTRLIKNKQIKAEIDVLIVGASSERIMISVSEVKSGKRKRFGRQLKKLHKILGELKSEFEKQGYKAEISLPKSLLGSNNIKTLELIINFCEGMKAQN